MRSSRNLLGCSEDIQLQSFNGCLQTLSHHRARGGFFLLGKYSVKMKGLKKREQELCSASTDVAETNSDEGPVTLRDYRDE